MGDREETLISEVFGLKCIAPGLARTRSSRINFF